MSSPSSAPLFSSDGNVLEPSSDSSGLGEDELVPESSSPTKASSGPSLPLAARIAMERRAVIFSPRNFTKIFNSDDSIIPALSPPSIRSYASDPPRQSPVSDSTRGILRKRRIDEIRIASSVEEGTLHNKEAARLLVTGRRPRLMARDSFQLAMIRKAAGEMGEKTGEELNPGSDDSISSDEAVHDQDDDSEEEEEQVEQDGALATSSLVNIILDGAEDLLTLEEAYNTLLGRLRLSIPLDTEISESALYDIQIATRPIREEAPAMVRAIQRDLQRLLGKVPTAEGASPFRVLVPLQDSTPINRSRFTPSPTPKSPVKARQGYTESEVKYRREASGVGSALLRFLDFAFHTPHLYSCFSETDLQAILELVVTIPRTPKLPTPNPKRTYYLAILVLATLQIPQASVVPIQDKISRALECALNDNMGAVGKDSAPTKKAAFLAVTNLINTYTSIFFPHFGELLPACLKALISPVPLIRHKASAAIAAFAAAKYSLFRQATEASRDAFVRYKSIAQRFEIFVVSHLKSAFRSNKHMGEKKTEWMALEQLLKDTVTTDVYWACATWSTLVALIGSSFASSGLSSSIDFIMDRSLQPSTNTTRPLLARISWCHAIHAYFLSCSAVSVHEGRVVWSFKPFSQDTVERTQLPVDLALTMALTPESFHLSMAPNARYNEPRCTWVRKEKVKKVAWMLTCGTTAASVIYAYMGAAIKHQDQPAREVSAISGLPSSDGAPMPESAIEDVTMARLDKTWDRVVCPMLKQIFEVHGLDKLKLHGWAIFEALIRTDSTAETKWDLDRLLCTRYLDGEVLCVKEKDDNAELLTELERQSISPGEIPSLSARWIVTRLDKVLDLFQHALEGIAGVSELYPREVVTLPHGVVFPVVLGKIWGLALTALASTRDSDPEEYVDGLCLVTRHLCQAFNRDPAKYLPACLMDSIDLDCVRIVIFNRLLEMAYTILGPEAISVPQLARGGDQVDSAMAKMAFGSDGNGSYSMAGALLSLIMASKVLQNLQPAAREEIGKLMRKLLEAGCASVTSNKFLGDVTNRLHGAFEDQEDVQLELWRMIARKWSGINTGRTSTSTNHTGALLVSLLSLPFRGKTITSSWHQNANEEDLAIWQNLLAATVARFRAKRVGANLGVLESLAGHLGDFLRDAEKTSSTTITLSCLAAATSYISFGILDQHHESHYSINENFVPTEFLALVSTALVDAYPRSQTLDLLPGSQGVSPGVYDLLAALKEVMERVPAEFAWPVLEPLQCGCSTWLSDDSRVVETRGLEVDGYYIGIVSALSRAVSSGHLAPTNETLDLLLDLYAPRLSRATSRAVPQAFQGFFKLFRVDANLSEEVRGFLQGVMAAVPGFIEVDGLDSLPVMSEEESMARFPHAQALGSDTVILQQAEMTAYDADISQLDTQNARLEIPVQSPNLSETESERHVSEEISSLESHAVDVFGSSEMSRRTRRPKGKGKVRKEKSDVVNEEVQQESLARPARLPSLSSFISKVGGWISPSRPDATVATPGPETNNGLSRSRSEPSISCSSGSGSSSAGSRKRKWVPVVEVPVASTRRSKRARSRAASAPREVVEVDSEEEDVLLLSPESARKRREEELKVINKARGQRLQKEEEMDDNDAQPRDGTNPSPVRTTQQTRILSMVEEAARAKDLIDKLNFDDLMLFMRNVEELRGAAQANLTSRAEQGRRR